MFSALTRSPRLRSLAWDFRERLQLSPASDDETLHRLRRRARLAPLPADARAFRFPWGDFRYVDAGLLVAQFEEIFIGNQYRFTTLTPNPVIVDAGGNVGLSAIWFKRAYPTCSLTVYEPDPDLAATIERNLASAGITDIDLRRAAVWVCDGRVHFAQDGRDTGRILDGGAATVPAVDLAQALPARVDLLKLDIEGAEYAVLDHLCRTGAIQRVQNLVAEFHVWRDHTDRFLHTLAQLRAAGLQFSLAGGPLPWIGTADFEAPFAQVGRNHLLLEVFAWREPAQ